MGAETILARLDGVRQTSTSTWRAKCPAHGSHSQSLSIRETDDGRVLIHCFAGCDTYDVLGAVGLEMDDLFSERRTDYAKPESRPFPAADCLRAILFEALIVSDCGRSMRTGEAFNNERLMLAVERISSACTMAGV